MKKRSGPWHFLQHSWHSDTILAGQGALSYLLRHLDRHPALFASMETALIEAGHDADFDVRRLALRVLERRSHPALPALASEQLADVDPDLRLLGLDHLARAGSVKFAALVGPLLNDPDPRVALAARSALGQWRRPQESPPEAETKNIQHTETQRWQEWPTVPTPMPKPLPRRGDGGPN